MPSGVLDCNWRDNQETGCLLPSHAGWCLRFAGSIMKRGSAWVPSQRGQQGAGWAGMGLCMCNNGWETLGAGFVCQNFTTSHNLPASVSEMKRHCVPIALHCRSCRIGIYENLYKAKPPQDHAMILLMWHADITEMSACPKHLISPNSAGRDVMNLPGSILCWVGRRTSRHHLLLGGVLHHASLRPPLSEHCGSHRLCIPRMRIHC